VSAPQRPGIPAPRTGGRVSRVQPADGNLTPAQMLATESGRFLGDVIDVRGKCRRCGEVCVLSDGVWVHLYRTAKLFKNFHTAEV